MSNQFNHGVRDQQRAAAKEYHEQLEANANRRERRRRQVSIFVVGAMLVSFIAPLFFR